MRRITNNSVYDKVGLRWSHEIEADKRGKPASKEWWNTKLMEWIRASNQSATAGANNGRVNRGG